jgi:hypothetical protein
VAEHRARVRQAGERVGERVLLGALVDAGVVDDGGRLFADAVDEAPVVVGVGVLGFLVDGQRADQRSSR